MKLRTPPSARRANRYLVLRVHSSGPLRYENFKAAVLNQLLEWLGEDEFAKAGLGFVKNLWEGASDGATAFLRCHPKYVERVKLGLALLSQVGDARVIVQTARVSGTIAAGRR